MEPRLNVSSDRLEKLGIKAASLDLLDKWFIHCSAAAPDWGVELTVGQKYHFLVICLICCRFNKLYIKFHELPIFVKFIQR